MKKIILILSLILYAAIITAQQNPYFSSIRMNQYLSNPGYYGHADLPNTIDLTTRSQWTGFDDAPETQMIVGKIYIPHQRIALGMTLYRDSAPPYSALSAIGNFAYSIKVNNTNVSVGARVSYDRIRVPLSQLETNESNDEVFQVEDLMEDLVNFGTGLYIDNKRFFVSASIPYLLSRNIHEANINDQSIFRGESQFFVGGGLNFQHGDILEFIPSVFVRNEFNLDNTVSLYFQFIYDKNYEITPFFKFNQSRGAQLALTKNKLRFGYSYEHSTTPIRVYNGGTHEISVGYILPEIQDRKKLQTEF